MFRALIKFSLIDFPSRIASTLFTGGCNFRCPWCHNAELISYDSFSRLAVIEEEDVETYLLSKKEKIEGVCVSGGEPTLWGERLALFFGWCIRNGFSTKLDTNGYLPDVLEEYVKMKLLNFVAMDIKNIFSKYPETAGVKSIDVDKIKKSIEIIKSSGLPHQFRTTMVPGLVIEEEIKSLSRELGEDIVMQEYRDFSRESRVGSREF
jgi:pyruvate formate lyase activating enzyme